MSIRGENANQPEDSLTAEERAFVARVRDGYAPAPQSAAQRASFDQRLEQRLARSALGSWLRPLPVAATATAALALGLLVSRTGLESQTIAPEQAAVAELRDSAEDALLALGTDAIADSDDALPNDYVAIETLFLGGI